MISKITFAFLNAVKENNNLEWMNKNRDLYHMERDNFLDFSKQLIEKVRKLDKNIGDLKVKDATFRFNKDIRFTKDKSPYKTNFGVIIREEGKRGTGAGYYVHIQPGASFIGGGMYMPPAPTLQRVRIYIAKHYKQLEKIISTSAFKKTFGSIQGDELVNVPRGFDKEHKAGKFLKMKSFFVGHDIPDKQAIEKDFLEYCIGIFKVLKPLNDFL
ncbi:MAG: DUF2461 domain-containing protein, partial [candidate division SR1 bacterium]|nr:DUF2461 domain-containing protein [candidate division SR1 bacterium]